MANVYGNRIKVVTSTTGTGTITLGSAVSGFQTFADGGISNGNTVAYTIEDGANFEIGTGTYTSSGTTLSRSVTESSNSDSAINLSGNAVVFVTPRATDLPFTDGATFTGDVTVGNGSTSAGSIKFLEDSDNGTNGITLIGPASTSDVTFTLPSADGSANTFLKTDGSGTLSFAAAGADLYTANESSPTAQPSATGTNAIAIGDSASAGTTQGIAIGREASTSGSGNYSIALGYQAAATGDGSFAGQQGAASGSSSLAIGTSARATNTNSIAIGYDAESTADYSSAYGRAAHASGTSSGAFGRQAEAAGTYAVALAQSYASGTNSFAAGITDNTNSYGATGANSIAIGKLCKATNTGGVAIGESNTVSGDINASAIGGKSNSASGYYAIASGGQSNSVTGARSGIVAGSSNTVSGSNSVILGGSSNTASGQHCFIFGQSSTASENYAIATGYYSKAAVKAKIAHSAGNFAALGDAQSGQFVLRADTTDATATVLTTNNSTAATDNQIVAASDTCIAFHGTLVAMQNGAQSFAGFRLEGLLVNDGGTTTLPSGVVNTFQNSSSWTVALSADDTNEALAITVTGEASHNIRWVANISTSEVTYA